MPKTWNDGNIKLQIALKREETPFIDTLGANGEEVTLKSWYSGKSDDCNPNNTGEAVAKFDGGKYQNEVYTYVDEDGKLPNMILFYYFCK